MPAVILLKPITPKKLDDKAMQEALVAEAEAISKDILLDYVHSTATWKRQVKFERVVAKNPNSIEILVGTDDEIFSYVDLGTKAHVIRPKRAKSLHFYAGGSPKTVPNIIPARFGSPGTDEVFTQEVHHPGTRARNITKTITKKWAPRYRDRMTKAMNRAVKASGHAM